MRLARKRIGMLNKIIKRIEYLDYRIDNDIYKEKAEIERQKLANFILFYSSFKPFEELVCCKYKGFYIPWSKYMEFITQDYEKGYEEAKDLFNSKYEYVSYALKNHFKDEDVDVLMLRPNLEVL